MIEELAPQPINIKLSENPAEMQVDGEKEKKKETSTATTKKRGRPKVVVTMELESNILKEHATKKIIARTKVSSRQGRKKTRD